MSIVRTAIESEDQWHELRAGCVGASEVGALLGCHPYLTGYGLWARKTGRMKPTPDNAVLMRGRLMEPVAVKLLAERLPGWSFEIPKAHYLDPEIKLGATPDLFAQSSEQEQWSVQVKSVEPSLFRDLWITPGGDLQPPLFICAQAIAEAHLTGRSRCAVAALVVSYGIELHFIEVPIHAGLIERARALTASFWQMVAEGREPDPDYCRDGSIIRALLGESDGTEVDLTGDNELPEICAERARMIEARKAASEKIDEFDARILHKVGGAERARFNGGVITAKTQHRKAYPVAATSFRALRVKIDPAQAAPKQ